MLRCKVCDLPLTGKQRSFCGQDCKNTSEKARMRARYEAEKQAWIARSKLWKAEHPEATRESNRNYARENRARTAARESSYRSENRQRYSEHKREWYKRNADRARAAGRVYASARRARVVDAGVYRVTERDLSRALNRYGHTCSYCAADLRGQPMDWDHVVPISRGGSHSVGNLRPACVRCNRAKSARTVMEWRVRSGFDLGSLVIL